MADRSAEPRWLDDEELETWRALHVLLTTLPAALGAQLQKDSGLSFLEYYVLAGLSEQPHRSLRLSVLAVLANSELSRLSHLVARLEKRGLLRREPDPDDGRFTNAVLTDAGMALVEESAPGHVGRVRELVFDVLTQTEQRTLRRAAQKILAGLADGC
jgi:DNA-binding MarR family transcriptional regulator